MADKRRKFDKEFRDGNRLGFRGLSRQVAGAETIAKAQPLSTP